MLTYLRYALATICFVLSVGCFVLLWRDVNFEWCVRISEFDEFIVTVWNGLINVEIYRAGASTPMNCRPTGASLFGSIIVFATMGAASLPVSWKTVFSVVAIAALLGLTAM